MSARPLTILQLTHQGGGSGSTTIIADLSRQLARRGHRVLVGCRPDTKLAHLARDAGLELVPLDFRRLGPLARALGEVTDREGVDVVNSNATRDRRALTWLRWTRRLGRPFVVTRHTMPLTSPAELVAVGLSADRTIAASDAVARALSRRLHPAPRSRPCPRATAWYTCLSPTVRLPSVTSPECRPCHRASKGSLSPSSRRWHSAYQSSCRMPAAIPT